jgi:hypothetical protein
MFAGTKLRDIPGRVATGLYILNAGLGKRHATAETAGYLHGAAAGAFPFLKDVPPEKFVATLSKVETALGATLLTPLVPTRIAASALAAFSGGLVTMYLRTPALRMEHSIRPSEAGTAIAKDSWMLGMSLGFLIDVCGRGRRHR